MSLGRIAAVIGLAMVAPTAAVAQAPAPAPAVAAPTITDWIGTWTGAFNYGTMTLTIGREASKWMVSCLFEGEGLPSEDVRMWSVEGRAFSWVQTVGPYDLFVRGTFEEGVLKGSFEVYKQGVYGETEVFVLRKAP